MDIWDSNKLVVFIGFVIPGFLSLKVYELLSLQGGKDSSQQIIDAVAYSCINYALLLFPILWVEERGWADSEPTLHALFWGAVVLVMPVLWPCAIWGLRRLSLVQRLLPHPVGKPWDYVFRERRPFWLIITLKDGRKVGGRYDSKSFATSSPHEEQIYLQEAWEINGDGGLERPRVESAGIMVLGGEIATVELFKYIEEKNDAGRQLGQQIQSADPGQEGVPAGADTSQR